MTVSSTTTRNSYSGDGSTTAFAYGFKIFASSDLTVILRSATGVETVQTETTHYTVSNVGVASGGNVTFGSAPASGVTVVIRRNSPLTQLTDYTPNDPFPADDHENALDKLTFISQQQQEELDRSIKLSRTNTMTSTEFTTSATDRASKILAFDTSGELSVTQELGTFRGDFAASTAYNIRDLVKDTSTGNVFFVNEAHTSSGSEPLTSNANASKYSLILDATQGVTAGTVSASKVTVVDSSKDLTGLRNLTITGELDAATLDISGNVDVDGTLETDALTIDGVTLAETISDTVGAMVGSNTETGISVTYDDSDNTLDFVIGSGGITNAMLDGSIADSKLSTISTAGKVEIGALEIDGASDIGADLVDADLLIVDDGANGTEKKSEFTRVKKYVYSAMSGDATASDSGAVTIANNAVETAMINADAVTGAKIADDAINSEHYTDGSIDTAHIADDQVTLAKMAGLARGKIIVGDSSGNPTALTLGSNGEFLKSDGSDLVFGAATISGLAADDLTAGDAAINLTTTSGNITIDAQANDSDIIFKGTDNTADTTFLTIDGSEGGLLLPNNGIDLNGKELILDADADTSITADTDDEIDFKVAGSDAAKLTATRLGVGTASPLGGIHVKGNSEHGIINIQPGGTSGSDNFAYLRFLESGDDTTVGIQQEAELSGTNSMGLIISTLNSNTLADAFRIEANGSVGVKAGSAKGTNFTTTGSAGGLTRGFTVQHDSAGSFAAEIRHEGGASNRHGMVMFYGADDNHSSTAIAIEFLDGDGTGQGSITSTNGTVNYGAFTANHDVYLPDADKQTGYPYGTLMEVLSTTYKKSLGTGTTLERGIQYNVQKTSSKMSKAVMGAYACKYSRYYAPEDDTQYYLQGDTIPSGKAVGDVKTESTIPDGKAVGDIKVVDNPLHQVYILGDGHILCNNETGNIEIGDFITASSTAGIGMKATETGITCGVAREAITFSSSSETKLVAVEFGIRQFVAS